MKGQIMGSQTVVRDVVVVLPGIMGSTLSKNGKLVWAPSAGAVLDAIATFGRSIREMTLPNGIGDHHPNDGVEPVGLMPDLHLLPGLWSAHIGYGKLLNWLRARFHFIEPTAGKPDLIPNLLPIAYDWRLSNRYNGRRLKSIVEPALERWRAQGGPFADAKLIFICHSMGGLVARWYIEKEGGAGITRKLVTLGTPYRGALNALDQLVNGVKKGIGPFALNLTSFARSLPSVHQLLPEYACIESPSGLLKTTETTIPELETAMINDAMLFHDEVDQAVATRTADAYDIHPIVGTRQTTWTTARVFGKSLQPMETIGDEEEGGDATVPRLSAIPKGTRPDSNIICFIADQHGALQSNQAVLDQIEAILTAKPTVYRATTRLELGVKTEPVVLVGERITVEARVVGGKRVTLQAKVMNERGKTVSTNVFRLLEDLHTVEVETLPPGAYRIMVEGVGSMKTSVAPVACTVLVWGGSQ
ncbi:esterase/lipase family protein [Pelobacter propionicus]|nr:hypothetical protein [Pelobacter propionicus]